MKKSAYIKIKLKSEQFIRNLALFLSLLIKKKNVNAYV